MYNEYFYPQLKYVSHPINQSTVSRRYSGILSSLPNFWSPCAENVQLISVSASPSPATANGVHIVFISTLCQQMVPIIIHHSLYQQQPRVEPIVSTFSQKQLSGFSGLK